MHVRQRLQYAALTKVAEYAAQQLRKMAAGNLAPMPSRPVDLLQSAGGPGPAPVGSALAPQYAGPNYLQTPHIGLQHGIGMQVPANPLSRIPTGPNLLQSAGTPGQLNRAVLGGKLPVPNPQMSTPRGASLPRPAVR